MPLFLGNRSHKPKDEWADRPRQVLGSTTREHHDFSKTESIFVGFRIMLYHADQTAYMARPCTSSLNLLLSPREHCDARADGSKDGSSLRLHRYTRDTITGILDTDELYHNLYLYLEKSGLETDNLMPLS